MTFDPQALRQDFPILTKRVHDKPLVYFDNAASSQRPRQVLEAMQDYYENHHANVHRGVHTLATEATDLYEAARQRVADFINAPSPESLIFTRNTTEAINLIAYSWARSNLKAGDEIILSEAEHHCNLVPWHWVSQVTGAVIRAIKLTPEQRLDMEHYASLLNERTKLVTTWHMSNVLGAVNPIRQMADMAHDVGALMLVDGAQAVPHLAVDVQALDADFYAFSGHKMCGPTGAGALWAKADILRAMPPFLGGGEMIRKVYIDHSSYADIPMRFEAGTPNIAEAIGLAAAVDYLQNVGMDAIWQHDQALCRYALDKLRGMPGLRCYGPEGDDRGGIIAFSLEGAHPHDIASALDAEGIAVRAGHHCAQPLMQALGVQSTARASFYLYNTEAEVDSFVTALEKTQEFFAAFA